MKINIVLILALLLSLSSTPAFAYWVWSPEQGKFVNPEGGAAQDAAEEQYNYAMRFHREKNFDEAVKQLEDLLKKYPSSRIAPEAQYRLGTIFEERSDHLKAFDSYKKLVHSYPQSDRFTEVIEREFRLGNLFLSGQKGKLMGVEILPALPRAVEVFDHIVKNAPYSEYGDQAQFHLGLTYKKMGRFQEANDAFQAVIDQYPQSDLVAKARFQLAETSYERSASHFRDQRALDDAARNVDRFLARYPDAEASEKATKIRQVIDEKNAEKNYRVGRYYEKRNYLKSALIYYEDVAVRYPHTKWGKKAQEKLNALQEPAEYLSGREQEIAEKKKAIENQLKLVADGDRGGREELERQWERLDSQEKSLDSEKEDSLKRRRDDLVRREKELKQRFKNLEKKRKAAQDNTSEDFQRAMDRWHAALVSEQDALDQEKKQLSEWHETLGVDEKKDLMDYVPFMGDGPTELEKVRQIEAKKLYKLSENKKELFDEKENLYKQLDEVSALLRASDAKGLGLDRQDSKWLETVEVEEERVALQQKKLKQTRENVERLEEMLGDKQSKYQKAYGQSPFAAIVKAPVKLVSASAGAVAKSVAFVNPFDGKGKDALEGKNEQELLELRMHLQEKIAAQQNITETLSSAFNAELALQEQKRLLEDLEQGDQVDPHKLRKKIKGVEKEIRASYEEIDDRDKHKRSLMQELDETLNGKDAQGVVRRSTNIVTAPGRAVKAFLFGSPDESVELVELADRLPNNVRAAKLKEEIELESLMIEAKSRQIKKLEKEREILKAKASLAGGYKFRSAFVDVPYQFIGGAIKSAKKVIPRKEREEILIEKLNQETRELEEARAEMKAVEARIEEVTGKKAPRVQEKKEPMVSAESAVESTSEQKKMKSEIEKLMKRIEDEETQYQEQKQALKAQLKETEAAIEDQEIHQKIDKKQQKMMDKREKKLKGELEDVREELVDLITREKELEGEESEILEKRISHIDRVIKTVQSKALSQDLLNERERMESRISQIELRQDFLSKEMDRFHINESAATA